MIISPSASARLLCMLALCGAAGCNKAQQEQQKEPAAESPTACADYAKKVCDEVGEEAPTCASFKGATDLMPPGACAAGLANFDETKQKLGEAKKSCTELVQKLCAELGEETETCTMVKTQTASFPPERCTMMLASYDKVIADLKQMEARNKPLEAEQAQAIAADGAPSFGPESSEVTIVEFSDFQCPYCSRAAKVANQVKEKYGDQVRFVFRQFPLSFHAQAHLAAQAALAAHEQGKFWEYHDKLFADQSKLDRDSLEAAAKEVGLDMAQFKQALDKEKYKEAVDADLELGKQVNVSGTPTLFINGKRIADPTNFEVVAKAIDDALGKTAG